MASLACGLLPVNRVYDKILKLNQRRKPALRKRKDNVYWQEYRSWSVDFIILPLKEILVNVSGYGFLECNL